MVKQRTTEHLYSCRNSCRGTVQQSHNNHLYINYGGKPYNIHIDKL